MSRPKKPPYRIIDWQPQAAIFKAWVLRELKLIVYAARSDEQWLVTAVETPAETAEAVFDAHSHAILGRFDGLAAAVTESDRYGAEWLAKRQAGEGIAPVPCACDEIDDVTPVVPTSAEP